MKKLSVLLVSVLALAGCQTVRIQGVEITPERQMWASALLVAIGVIIVNAAEDDEPDKLSKCIKYQSVPYGKDAPMMCVQRAP